MWHTPPAYGWLRGEDVRERIPFQVAQAFEPAGHNALLCRFRALSHNRLNSGIGSCLTVEISCFSFSQKKGKFFS
jgi:hypothetical protein